jgi:hypothetical protein
MTYVADLEQWYQRKRAVGEVLDLKISLAPGTDVEKAAKAILETLEGKRETSPLDTSKL